MALWWFMAAHNILSLNYLHVGAEETAIQSEVQCEGLLVEVLRGGWRGKGVAARHLSRWRSFIFILEEDSAGDVEGTQVPSG